MTVAVVLLVVAMSAGAFRIVWSWLANVDDAERDAHLEACVRRRYAEPVNARSWQ